MFHTITARLLLPANAKVEIRRPSKKDGRSPSVTVIIPCYNYGRYLPECVRSALDQQDVRVNVLVIDDASTDGSAEIVRSLAAQDARISAICHETNCGHIATYNEGLALASGDYTVLISADDALTPGCLARATSLMDEYPSVGLTYGFPVEITDTYLPPARTVATKWIIWKGQDWIAQRCRSGGNVVMSPEAVVRTSVAKKIGGYRVDLPNTGDLEMWMRFATVSDVGYVAGADQAYYRIHSSNMHHSRDKLADISERLRSFDVIFKERSALLSNPSSMQDTAHRALAREALGHGIRAYARGISDREPVGGYVDFAFAAWPDAKNLREWRTLNRLRKMHKNWLKREPSLVMRETGCNLRYRLQWWRRRWAGV